MKPVEILLKEYETLRQEILTAMSNRISILSFGLASIGAIFTASIAIYSTNNALLSGLALTLAIPAISIFILFIWLGEYQRMQRAGKFLAGLEKRINEKATMKLLSWETDLRAKHTHMKYPYNSTVMLLLVISTISFIIGSINLSIPTPNNWTLLVLGLIGHISIYFYTLAKISKMQD